MSSGEVVLEPVRAEEPVEVPSQACKRAGSSFPALREWPRPSTPGGPIIASIAFRTDAAMTSDGSSERKPLAKFVQDAIDKGATTVEEIHKSIADLPLKILEESELLKSRPRKCGAFRITRSGRSTT